MKTLGQFLEEAKATYCGRCGTRHVPPSKGGTCPALKEELEAGTFGHFKHHVIGYIKNANKAAAQEEHNDDRAEDSWETSREHMKHIAKHYGKKTADAVGEHITSHKDVDTMKKLHASTLREGTIPTADEPTEHDKKMAQKVRDLLAKEKKPIKEDVVAQINDLVRQRNAAKSPIARKNLETQINRLKRQQRKMNEDLDLEEAVEVSHDRYRSSHGKKASGPGAWMFTHKRSGEAKGDDTFTAPATARSFTDAAKHAKAWAKSKGHRTVYVMEEVELTEMDKERGSRRDYDTQRGMDKTAKPMTTKKFAADALKTLNKEETEIEDAGTPHEFRKQKIIHKGEHVATIHTYRGRGGNWTSGVHNPDGSYAAKKYGAGVQDTKRDLIKKVKAYHKAQTENKIQSFGQFISETDVD